MLDKTLCRAGADDKAPENQRESPLLAVAVRADILRLCFQLLYNGLEANRRDGGE